MQRTTLAWSLVLVGLLCLSLFGSSVVDGHICLIYPDQRGGANVSTPGNDACFIPKAPCGNSPPQSPKIQLIAGTTFNVLLQQNLNHYNPGWPGFIDVAYAVGTNQTSDSQFTVLAQIPDYWPHLQGQQTNFSIPIIVPNIQCNHCTLRVRYHPNKPTEPIFHNCADVAIVQQPEANLGGGSIIATARYGPSHGASAQLSTFVSVSAENGGLKPLNNYLRISQRSVVPPLSEQQQQSRPNHQEIAMQRPSSMEMMAKAFFPSPSSPSSSSSSRSILPPVELYQVEGLIGVASSGQGSPPQVYFMGGAAPDVFGNNPAPLLTHLNPANGDIIPAGVGTPVQFPAGIQQWVGMASAQQPGSPLWLIGQQDTQKGYNFAPFRLWQNGSVEQAGPFSQPDNTYVNVFWTDYDPCSDRVFLLAGDENSLVALRVTLFTWDLKANTVSAVLVDNSKYTVTSVHVALGLDCQYLYSLSPGLLDTTEHVWSLIKIDPTTGKIYDPIPVSSPGFFTFYYGGGVYGRSVTQNGQLLHVFQRKIDGAWLLGGVDIKLGQMTFQTYLDTGVNNQISLNSITYVA